MLDACNTINPATERDLHQAQRRKKKKESLSNSPFCSRPRSALVTNLHFAAVSCISYTPYIVISDHPFRPTRSPALTSSLPHSSSPLRTPKLKHLCWPFCQALDPDLQRHQSTIPPPSVQVGQVHSSLTRGSNLSPPGKYPCNTDCVVQTPLNVTVFSSPGTPPVSVRLLTLKHHRLLTSSPRLKPHAPTATVTSGALSDLLLLSCVQPYSPYCIQHPCCSDIDSPLATVFRFPPSSPAFDPR
ncbi:hypothetical protein B0T10DRAFT_183164 [Thelonectria olida]|uniref:Uncharacterized protein n=1 Tax=Thelonectria olida TaxID=1576542 RepID=A0A9P9AS20_9HYPO|nr:hypothetical protein B0T10DRAFT_183164 [Thelonectria olida]